jgi:hypothetical protein
VRPAAPRDAGAIWKRVRQLGQVMIIGAVAIRQQALTLQS